MLGTKFNRKKISGDNNGQMLIINRKIAKF